MIKGRTLELMQGVFLCLVLIGVWSPAHAILLTFDGNICGGGQACTNSDFIDQSYGDVAGQVNVIYSNIAGGVQPVPGLKFWDTQYNDLVNVAWTDGGDPVAIAEIFLLPEPGHKVTLNGFDLGAFPNTTLGSQYTILDGASNVLASSGSLTIGTLSNEHSSFSFTNIMSEDGIRIQWGPSAFNVGIDNVDFDVIQITNSVPIPSTLLIFGLGFAGFAAWRYRMEKINKN